MTNYNHSDIQVIHSKNQVKSVDELVIGEVYLGVHIDTLLGFKYKILDKKVNTKTIQIKFINGKDEFKFLDVEQTIGSGKPQKDKLYLADYGIIPYNNGKWNPANFLIPEKTR